MPFNHNLDGHLGETLRKRPGTSLTRSTIFLAGVLALAGAASAAPAKAPPRAGAKAPAHAAASPALPDTVVARMPHRDITTRDYVLAWHRVEPKFRPTGTTLADRKAFLDQLVERELVASAALNEPFVMTGIESAQFVATRDRAIRQALYKQLVVDSAVVLEADRDSARTRLQHSDPSKPPSPQAIEAFSRSALAEPRRAAAVDSMIKVALAPAWDDSAKARLARGYAALDPTKPDPNRPFSLKLNNRIPALAPADTALVLVRSTAGNLTTADYVRRFNLLNPFDTDFPVTPEAVAMRGEQFLGQIWFDQEAARRNIPGDPAVVDAERARREGIALDHWFARHVAAKVDTSDAVLKAWFAKYKQRYAIKGQTVVTNVVAPSQATADSLVAELRAGSPWDSVCARHMPEGEMRKQCGSASSVADDFPDSALVKAIRKLKPGQVVAQPLTGRGAPNVAVMKFVERIEPRVRSFAEARTFVVREVTADQSETLLQKELARLRRTTKVQRNETALARVDLEL